jgi:hypothetical protein
MTVAITREDECGDPAVRTDLCRAFPRLTIPSSWARRNLWSASPTPASACLADQPGLRRQTRSPPACRSPQAGVPRLREQKTQPERRLRFRIALRMLRPRRQAPQRQFLQQLADRTVVQADAKRCPIRCWRSTRRQRTTPSRFRSAPSSTQTATSACCSADRRGSGPLRRGWSDKPSRPLAIVAMHPVRQRLAIHRAGLPRLRT